MDKAKDAAAAAEAEEADSEAEADSATEEPGEAAAGDGEAVEAAGEQPGAAEAEPEDVLGAAEAGPEDALAAALTEIAELKDRLLRAMAETENVRRRSAREREEAGKYGIAGFASELVSVADNLRRAIASVPAEARQDNDALTSLLEGVELTERELVACFERHDIRPIEPMGEKFNHDWHQAVAEIDDPSVAAGTIVQVIRTGYAIADRLLRPAMVGVAKSGKGEDETGRKVDTTV